MFYFCYKNGKPRVIFFYFAQLFQHAFVVAAAVAVNNKTMEPLLFGHYMFRKIESNIFFWWQIK